MQGAFNIRNEVKAMREVASAEGIYVIQNNGATEFLTSDPNLFFQKLWLYPGKATVDGVLTANGANIRLGKSGVTDAVTVATIEAEGVRATVTTVDPHGFRVGQNITIAGATPANFNGTFQVTAVISSLKFEYRMTSAPGVNASTAGAFTATGLKVLPDVLTPTDLPICYELPLGQKMALSQIIIQGFAGDGVFYQYT